MEFSDVRRFSLSHAGSPQPEGGDGRSLFRGPEDRTRGTVGSHTQPPGCRVRAGRHGSWLRMTATHYRDVQLSARPSDAAMLPAEPAETIAVADSEQTPPPASRPSLRKNISWTLAGNVTYAACQWGILIAIARLGTLEMVGQFSLALAITAPVFIFAQMQSRQLQVTDVERRYAFADFLVLRLAAIGVSLAIVSGIVLASGYQGEFGVVIGWIALTKAFESVSDVIHGSFQRQENLKIVAWSLVARGVLTLLSVLVALWLTASLHAAVMVMAGVRFLVLFSFDLPVHSSIGDCQPLLAGFQARNVPSIVCQTLPLGIGSGLISLNSHLPRYFLQCLSGVEAVAIYSVAAAPLAIAGVVRSAVRSPVIVRAAQYYQTERIHAFRSIARKLTALEAGISLFSLLIFCLIGREFLGIIFGPSFVSAYFCLLILLGGHVIQSLGAGGSILFSASHRFWLHTLSTLIGMCALLPLCWVLTAEFGEVGAATAVSLQFIFSVAFVWKSSRLILDHNRGKGDLMF
jgi:O-antigen/teichoic acid export membrane protein